VRLSRECGRGKAREGLPSWRLMRLNPAAVLPQNGIASPRLMRENPAADSSQNGIGSPRSWAIRFRVTAASRGVLQGTA
jgi:hypothetical protein